MRNETALLIIFQLPISLTFSYIIDKLVGDPLWLPHPVVAMGSLISRLEKLIRKIAKTPRGLKIGGIFLWLITVGTSYATTAVLLYFAWKINFYLFFVLQTLIFWTGIAGKCLYDESQKVYHLVREKKLEQARVQIGYLVGRDTTQLRFGEIIRATVETVAENTVDGITAPLFYAMLGGAPWMMAYKAINTLDSMVGYKNKKYKDLGFFSAKMDDLANWIPARISMVGFIFAAAIKGLDYRGAQIIAIRDHKNHKSPNAGWPEAATAGALGVQLGGTNVYFGEVVKKPTIGDKKRELEAEDIHRAGQLMKKCADVMLLLYVLVLVVARFRWLFRF